MSDLKTNLQEILQEKQDKIIPENIKKDVQIFDVTGTYEGSGSSTTGVKLFETEEEMQADSIAQEGDLAVVYREEIQNMTADTQTQYITFPETVTLPEVFAGDAYCMLRAVDETVMFDGQVMLSQSMFDFSGYTDTGMIRIEYSSADGITYNRTRFTGDSGNLTNPVDLGTVIGVYMPEGWNDNMGYFMQASGAIFDGLYESVKVSAEVTSEKYISPFLLDSFYMTDGWYGTPHYSQCEEQYDGSKLANLIKITGPKNEGDSYRGLFFTADTDGNMYFIDNSSETNYYGAVLNPLVKKENDTSDVVILDNNKMVYDATGLNIYKIAPDYSSMELVYNNVQPTSTFMTGVYGPYGIYELPIKQKIYGANIRYYFTSNTFTIFGGPFVSGGDETKISIYYLYQESYLKNSISPIYYYSEVLIWELAKTQCNAIADDIYDSTAYGKTGPIKGTLHIIDNLTQEQIKKRIAVWNTFGKDNAIEMPVNCSSFFVNDRDLEKIPLLNTSNSTNMRGMFYHCEKLTSLPLLDTSKVEDMSTMFYYCTSLTQIPLLDTSSALNLQCMFGHCSALTQIPLLNIGAASNLREMFIGCTNLVEIPLLDTSSATSFQDMFSGCTNLVTIPTLNTEKVKNMYEAFTNCSSLSDDSLDNILIMCANSNISDSKTLKAIGLSQEQAEKCMTLSNYEAFTTAGWVTGY